MNSQTFGRTAETGGPENERSTSSPLETAASNDPLDGTTVPSNGSLTPDAQKSLTTRQQQLQNHPLRYLNFGFLL